MRAESQALCISWSSSTSNAVVPGEGPYSTAEVFDDASLSYSLT